MYLSTFFTPQQIKEYSAWWLERDTYKEVLTDIFRIFITFRPFSNAGFITPLNSLNRAALARTKP